MVYWGGFTGNIFCKLFPFPLPGQCKKTSFSISSIEYETRDISYTKCNYNHETGQFEEVEHITQQQVQIIKGKDNCNDYYTIERPLPVSHKQEEPIYFSEVSNLEPYVQQCWWQGSNFAS